MCKILRVL